MIVTVIFTAIFTVIFTVIFIDGVIYILFFSPYLIEFFDTVYEHISSVSANNTVNTLKMYDEYFSICNDIKQCSSSEEVDEVNNRCLDYFNTWSDSSVDKNSVYETYNTLLDEVNNLRKGCKP